MALARLGFGVAVVDGRGTPGRGNAFRDPGFPRFTEVGIQDHIAAIKQLAAQKPELDIRRVGIHGWSWGGTFSAQAILTRGDFYSVCVTGAGEIGRAHYGTPGMNAMTVVGLRLAQ